MNQAKLLYKTALHRNEITEEIEGQDHQCLTDDMCKGLKPLKEKEIMCKLRDAKIDVNKIKKSPI